MNNFYEELINVLKSKVDYLSEDGTILKNKIYELAMKMDEELLSLLFNNESIRSILFKKINDNYVFDKVQFGWIISNKEFLPDSYTRFKNKIGLSTKEFSPDSNSVVLNWPFKDCILSGGQTRDDQKRNEVFFNEILGFNEVDRLLDEKVFTNFKRFKHNGIENVSDIKDDDNLIIKGNNLLVISSLLKKYENKVKMIYIDPPYNTSGSTDSFVYNNTFKHSTWLTFMKNRLEVSKKLLREDGFIAVTIDHVELFYLGVILDEVFGRDNRVGIVTVYINPKGRQHEKFFSASTEYMIVYAKNEKVAKFNKVAIDEMKSKSFALEDEDGQKYRLEPFQRVRTSTLRSAKPDFYYPIYVSSDLSDITLENKHGYTAVYPIANGKEYSWKTIPRTFVERNKDGFYVAKRDNGEIKIYHKYLEQQVLKNIWINKKYFPEFQGTNVLKKILGENLFSYPKSIYAVLDTLKIMTNDDDIILDFFAGSGTTGHAVEELNKEDGGTRKFILVEQMDYIKPVTVERMKRVIEENGNGSFVYCELMELNESYIEKIQSADTSEKLVNIFKELKDNAFVNYRVDIEKFKNEIEEFKLLNLEEQKMILIEILDKNMLYVNYSDIDDKTNNVSSEEKKLNNNFYKGE